MPETALAAHNISVTHGRGTLSARALDSTSAEFNRGQVTLLMGASGSGKPTLLSILGCLRKPDAGHITLLGMDLKRADEEDPVLLRRGHIGFVFQSFRLFRSLTALENVRIGLQLSDQKRKSRAAEEALEAVALSNQRHLLPEQMSGGERQRVAIARALVKNPQILLADEPTAALDSVSGQQIAELIRSSVKARGMVAILATHHPRLTPHADRIIQIHDGKLRSSGEGGVP